MSRSHHLYLSDDTYSKMEALGITNISQFLREKVDEAHQNMIEEEKKKSAVKVRLIQINDLLEELETETKTRIATAKLEEDEWQKFSLEKSKILEEARQTFKSEGFKGANKIAQSFAKYKRTQAEIIVFLMNNAK